MLVDKFDLQTIGGMQFNVQQQSTGELMTIKVIKAELLFEVIRAHTLYMDDPSCEVVDLLEFFTGFVGTPYHVSWYTTSNPNDIPSKAVIQAAKEGNQIVVAEVIPKQDADNGGIRAET